MPPKSAPPLGHGLGQEQLCARREPRPWRFAFGLHKNVEVARINHEEAYSFDGASTNWAESYSSRLRRPEIGHHHHVAGNCLLRYAQESSWREDNRRVPNGEQVNRIVALALFRKPSVDFSGYWQRHVR